MHAPRTTHYQLLKRILRYVKGTSGHGLQIYKSANHDLIAYSDADWTGCPDTRRQLQDIMFSMVIICSHGPPSDNLLCPDQVQRLNTVQ